MTIARIVALIGVLTLAASPARAQISDGVVKIGVLNDQSGLYADLAGQGSVVAARMAVEDYGATAKGLKVEIETNPDRKPDFGPPRLHPTAGACIVGARPVLIAWNVNLRTTDVGVAKRIARAIRESDGGLPAVRAKGFDLADRGLVQVSMNMVDYRKTSLVQAFEAIRALAAKEGVEIAESEIIGLVPLDALVEGATQYFKLARFHGDQILETRLWE